jgi:hypothetical protein
VLLAIGDSGEIPPQEPLLAPGPETGDHTASMIRRSG